MHFCRKIRLNSVTSAMTDDDWGKRLRIHIENQINHERKNNLRNLLIYMLQKKERKKER